tara:strand:+ start:397 stop:660 length:264 start_codon:yes stop_codon:yes gene_type:complete
MSDLTKGEIRKLNALKKSIGDKLGQKAFDEWRKANSKVENVDKVAEKIVTILSSGGDIESLNLGSKGYTVYKSRGRGKGGIRAVKNT